MVGVKLTPLDELTRRVFDTARQVKFTDYGGGPDFNACRSIALRLLTIMEGKIECINPPKSYLSEVRPYFNNTHCDSATDPEEAATIPAKEGSWGSVKVFVDLNLRLLYTEPLSGQKVSVVVSSVTEFAGPGQDEHVVLWRGDQQCIRICTNLDFRKALFEEFGLAHYLKNLAEQFIVEREKAWAIAQPIAQKHAQRTHQARMRKETPEFKTRRTTELRKKAQESISKELFKGRLGSAFKKFTPEQFFEMYKLVSHSFGALEQINSWQGRNPSASQEITIEDVKSAYELATVKDVMEA